MAALRPERPIRPSGPINSIRVGSPASADLGQGSSASAQYTRGPPAGGPSPQPPLRRSPWAAQVRGRREKASFNRRSPADNPTFASSPTISAADATSSAPPGGCTEPFMFSLSDSNPCLGAASCRRPEPAGRLGALLALSPGVLDTAGLRDPDGALPAPMRERAAGRAGALLCAVVPAAASRAAARRGLERCGRVWGRLTSTSRSPCGVVGRDLPLALLIQSTVVRGLGGRGSAGRLNVRGRGVSMGLREAAFAL